MVLSLSKESALRATEVLLAEQPEDINDDVVDAVGEMCQHRGWWCQGTTRTVGNECEPSTVITGKNHLVGFPSEMKPVCIPFHCEWGDVTVEVGLVEQPTEVLVPADNCRQVSPNQVLGFWKFFRPCASTSIPEKTTRCSLRDQRGDSAPCSPSFPKTTAANHRSLRPNYSISTRTGARLSVPVELPLSRSLRLHLAIEEFALMFYLRAEVCWSAPRDQGGWEIGCCLNPGIPSTLFAVLAKGGRLDRRHVARYKDGRKLLAIRGNRR